MSYIKSDAEFDRNIWCLLGLPFDIVTMNDVILHIRDAATKKRKLFLSTPNLNFLIGSLNDNDFHTSIINSDLSIADGRPIIWIARLLKIPLPERVAGSDLIEHLQRGTSDTPLKVFFFGGKEGMAKLACEQLCSTSSGLKCVGYLNPGFGTIDEMSTDKIMNSINQANADFIIVSLGAKKGQAWIENNWQRLNSPVVSHLGAVVNFIAGTVNRSPKVLQKLGLEWLWRVKEEPVLWKRYLNDGVSFMFLFFSKVIPLLFITRLSVIKHNKKELCIDIVSNTEFVQLNISGYIGFNTIIEVNNSFKKIVSKYDQNEVNIVINENAYIDGAFIAKLFLLKKILTRQNRRLVIKTESKLIRKIFQYNCSESLLYFDNNT